MLISGRGSAYTFGLDSAGEWVEQRELMVVDTSPWDWFGISVSISGESGIVGSFRSDSNGTESGSTYTFESKK